MGSIVMNRCHIQRGTVVAAGALVTEGTVSNENSLLLGSPAREKKRGDEMLMMAEANYKSYGWLREKYLSDAIDRFPSFDAKLIKGRVHNP
jgi:carbonic anhydrase/acetyltransferase-like protein (isoleucine patch superfamily)